MESLATTHLMELDVHILTDAIALTEDALSRVDRVLTPQERAKVIALVYERMAQLGEDVDFRRLKLVLQLFVATVCADACGVECIAGDPLTARSREVT